MAQQFEASGTSTERYGAVVVTVLRDQKLAPVLRHFFEVASNMPQEELQRIQNQFGLQPQQLKDALKWLQSAPALR